jgi:hypothetical protein
MGDRADLEVLPALSSPSTARTVHRHQPACVPAHVAALRIESGLYFANADTIRAQILQAAKSDQIYAVVLDAETIPFVRLLVARDVGQVRDVMRHVADDPALTHVYPTVQAAVDAASSGRPARAQAVTPPSSSRSDDDRSPSAT